MSRAFGDFFSAGAGAYRSARPHYPAALFERVFGCVSRFGRAWDCASGSGQALAPLLRRFDEVVASDASVRQLAEVAPAGKLLRVNALADRMPLPDASVDLVTVAQAWHWFAGAAFGAEVRRVLRPDGLFAAWSYGRCRVTAAIDVVVDRLHDELLGPWWPAERRLVERGYTDLEAPFAGARWMRLSMASHWRCEQFLDYLATWSAVTRARAAGAPDPLGLVAPELRRTWGSAATRTVSWPLVLCLAGAATAAPA